MNNKLLSLSNYLKDKNLKKEYLYLKKIAQSDLNDFEEYFSKKEVQDWLKDLPKDELILASSGLISSITDTSGSCSIASKPKGLWYAIGSDWINLLTYENSDRISEVNYIYKVKPKYSSGLNSSGGVLKLNNKMDVINFSTRFGTTSQYGTGTDRIDWAKVSTIWDGVEIIPYQDSLRLSDYTEWYYAWDLPSGCIWRSGGASDLELIRSGPGL